MSDARSMVRAMGTVVDIEVFRRRREGRGADPIERIERAASSMDPVVRSLRGDRLERVRSRIERITRAVNDGRLPEAADLAEKLAEALTGS